MRQRRASNLNLLSVTVRPEEGEGDDDDDMPSPAPTLLTLRQARQAAADRTATGGAPNANITTSDHGEPNTPTEKSSASGSGYSRAGYLMPRRWVLKEIVLSVGTEQVLAVHLSGSTVVDAALVTRYPLSRGYDLYGTRGTVGPDTEPGAERATNRTESRGASDTENGIGMGLTRRSNNVKQGNQPASRGGSARVAGKRKSRRWSVFDGILHPASVSQVSGMSSAVPTQRSAAPTSHPRTK